MKVVWVAPTRSGCGISDYSAALWPSVERYLSSRGIRAVRVAQGSPASILAGLEEFAPDLVHFQHEYGIWGGKNPPFYRFPGFVGRLRARLPGARLVATAHTVLSRPYRLPLEGRGWQIPLRWAANVVAGAHLNRIWSERTWGGLDAVVVHSALQRMGVAASGVRRVEVIPHFVPARGVEGAVARDARAGDPGIAESKVGVPVERRLLVFGFLTPEKGQDVAIEALSRLPAGYRLVLAGGVRRRADAGFRDRCTALAARLGVTDRLTVTGYVEAREIDRHFRRADLVLAPFRETSGSGSLAQALSRGAAVLASDLPLNSELNERQAGCLALYRAGDPEDCASKIRALCESPERRAALAASARAYASANSPDAIARQHADLYVSLGAPA